MALENDDRTLTAEQAQKMSCEGEITLIDVRNEDEWKSTGVAENAKTICMSDNDFLGKITEITNKNKDAPLAIICAAGGRSARVCQALHEAGYNFVYDVAEGMVGGPFGSGWLNKKLPTKKYDS